MILYSLVTSIVITFYSTDKSSQAFTFWCETTRAPTCGVICLNRVQHHFVFFSTCGYFTKSFILLFYCSLQTPYAVYLLVSKSANQRLIVRVGRFKSIDLNH